MSKILDFIKEKSYYLLGATVLLIIVLIVINSCSGSSSNSYEQIEQNMISAAKQYFESRGNLLPKEGNARVSITTLVESELIGVPTDPSNSSNTCSGYVEVEKIDDTYVYTPFLTCEGSYEPKYLSDIVKETKTDDLGDGVYIINNNYVYRGKNLKNYVSFDNKIWRIVSVSNDGITKLVLSTATETAYPWDTRYNTTQNGNLGITTDYLYTNIRATLKDYYKNNFSAEAKAKLVKRELCVGPYLKTDEFSSEKECLVKQEGEYVGLLNVSDYYYASLDENCKTLESYACENRNYLNDDTILTWTLNSVAENNYEVFYIYDVIGSLSASDYMQINPVIYLSPKVIVNEGEGTLEKPYIIK